jgi:hypothetical protein
MREFVDLAFADREQRRNIGHSEGRCPLFMRIGEIHGLPQSRRENLAIISRYAPYAGHFIPCLCRVLEFVRILS